MTELHAHDGPVGVVVMAYGTPRSPEDVEAYYTHIRRGRPPTPEQLANLQRRYNAIGGISPLAARTESQRAAIQAALDRLEPNRFRVVLGQKHSSPFIEDAVESMVREGVRRIVGLVLAPHYSEFSVGEYQRRLREAAEPSGATTAAIESWHTDAAYLSFLTDALAEARSRLPVDHQVVFTAHSLPERVLEGDPYPDQLRESAAEVARRSNIADADWSIGWQSAGATAEPWRGPDILTIIRELGVAGTTEGICVCAQGFVADHLEVLYDLDIEAKGVADEVGLAFSRTKSLNADPAVIDALARRVVIAAEET